MISDTCSFNCCIHEPPLEQPEEASMKKSTIPPLPSYSKRPRPTLGKENCIPPLPNRKLPVPVVPMPSLSDRTSPDDSLSITTPMRSSRVLRFSETVDNFFCLKGGSGSNSNYISSVTNEHRRLCEDIALDRDGAASDLKKWSIVLEAAKESVEGIEEEGCSAKSSMAPTGLGKDLIRLHKRAASRFISFIVNDSTSAEDLKNLFTIWLLYAKVQAKFGQEDAARKTFRHIQHTKMGEKEADFYISLAQFEYSLRGKDSLENAIQVLKTGIDKGVEPKEYLLSYLQQLTLEVGVSADASYATDMNRDPGGDILIPNCAGADSVHVHNQNLQGMNSKVPKLKGKPLSLLQTRNMKADIDANSKSIKSGSFIKSGIQTSANAIYKETLPTTSRLSTSKERFVSLVTKKRELSNVESKSSDRPVSSSLSILNKKRRLGEGVRRGAIKGGAQRVSTVLAMDQTIEEEDEGDEPNYDISYLLNWNPNGPSNEAAKNAVLEQRATKKLHGSEDAVPPALKFGSHFRPAMSMIQESTTEHISSSVGILESSHSISLNTTTSRQHSESLQPSNKSASSYDDTNGTEKSGINLKSTNSLTSEYSSRSNQSSTHAKPHDVTGPDDRKISCARSIAYSQRIDVSSGSRESSTRSTRSESVKTKKDAIERKQVIKVNESFDISAAAKGTSEQTSPSSMVHPDFRKIASYENVISVNSTPYIKLRVIGSGGSCKVYSALSKDREIVAIKKVKIAGMARKAIEGYANEIALLRRLRGNQAIIQLYDSEVDIKRMAIFLVMEPGEVDLNYVLQKQGTKKIKGEQGSFVNMNFVRLTWQQMLSAVHCIHEERIIHGDLKPANFLFVKGVLKLIDFGIAKAIQNDETTNIHRENHVGTLNYMSPESMMDSGKGANGALIKCGRPSDIWSLGCILYQMCYSKTPFADLLLIPKLHAIINPDHEIAFPATIDKAAIDAMKLSLRWKPEERATIVGEYGLLNKHKFLN